MRTGSWITRTKSQPRLRLFCFPYAGGGASIFRLWSEKLPVEVEVCPIYLPGRENRMKEPLLTHLSPLVQTLAHALHPFMDIPFAFFGHSMGALVSFGLARTLRRQNGPSPMHLFVSAYRAPQIPVTEPPIHQLPERALIEKLLRFNGTKREVLENAELRQLLLPLLRADFAVCETYSHASEEPLSCPITAFGGLQDSRVSPHDLAAWREQTSNSFSLRMLPGGHFFWHEMPQPLLQAMLPLLTQPISTKS